VHIQNAMLDPRAAAATSVIGAAALAYGLRRVERELGDKTVVLMGTMAAFVFAAQMVNFPLGPLGVSGHLLGGVLAAVLLGPWAGAVVIAVVLIVQCLLFGDGGLASLGANFVNMGVVGALGGYAIYAPIRRAIGGKAGVTFAAMAAAWFSVILAAAAFSVELAMGGSRAKFFGVLGWMTLVHAAIGVGEAIITGLIVRFVLATRPDLIEGADPSLAPVGRRQALGVSAAGLGVALAVVALLAPLASEHPDGLEFVAAKFGLLDENAPASLPVPIPEYQLPGLSGWGVGAATAAAGAVGTLVVFAAAVVLARAAAVPRAARRVLAAAGPGPAPSPARD
jgi:cobalt/nickel transport system permease protein